MIKSWFVIGSVTFVVALASSLIRINNNTWFRRLRRPSWLVFENAIPLIWTTILICGAWSAVIMWEREPGTTRTWLLMAFYLLLELMTLAYSPVMIKYRSLNVGVIIGGTGFVLCLLLALTVLNFNQYAALLLVPYLLWSPIGTYTTWEMINLNPEDA